MNVLIFPLSKTKAKSIDVVSLSDLKVRESAIQIANIVAVTDLRRAAILKNRDGKTGIVSLAEFQAMTAA